MSDRKIGYIGLGNMGGGMASHLVASGYDVTVFDLRAEAVQALVDKGATAASSPKDVAEKCDVIISSPAYSAECRERRNRREWLGAWVERGQGLYRHEHH